MTTELKARIFYVNEEEYKLCFNPQHFHYGCELRLTDEQMEKVLEWEEDNTDRDDFFSPYFGRYSGMPRDDKDKAEEADLKSRIGIDTEGFAVIKEKS